MARIHPKSNQVQKYKLLADTTKEDTNINLEMLILLSSVFLQPIEMPGNPKNN